MEIKIAHLKDLTQAAKKLLEFSGEYKIFLFYGEMGAGKTTFIKSLCDILLVKDSVSSPTFSLVNEYVSGEESMYHFDFYRIKKETEALDMGYEDYLYSGNYCFIEWPQKIENLLPEKFVEVNLRVISNGERMLSARLVN